MYGVEISNPTEGNIKHLTTTIVESFAGRGSKAGIDLVCHIAIEHRVDMDPVVRILHHRVTALRRAMAKKPDTNEQVCSMIDKYKTWVKEAL